MFVLEKVISGGQTGVDQVALEIARAYRYETGGWAPKGWRTDEGPMEALLRGYGLVETRTAGYTSRTLRNIRESDLTVWFGDPTSPGGVCTLNAIERYSKPFLINPTALGLFDMLTVLDVHVMNVAGNRQRTHPASSELARAVLGLALAPGPMRLRAAS